MVLLQAGEGAHGRSGRRHRSRGRRDRAILSRDWQICGPNGGYLAVIALRRPERRTALRRPASFYAQYLSAAEYGPVKLVVETLRGTKRTAALRVTMTQSGRTILLASAWIVDEALPDLKHEAARMPEVPPPEGLLSFAELGADGRPWDPFWRSFDVPTHALGTEGGVAPWLEPHSCGWLRLVPKATFDDPFIDAGRSLVLLDTWPAANAAHGPSPFVAPNVAAVAVGGRLAVLWTQTFCKFRWREFVKA